MKEKRQFFNSNCEPTGKYYYKGDKFPPDCFAIVVMIAIQNSNGDFMMQQRAEGKSCPHEWTVTGGHPTFDETNLQGIVREVQEELGLDISSCKIDSFWKGFDGRVCREMYFTKLDVNLSDLVLQEEEVEDVAWFSRDKIISLMQSQQIIPNQIDFYNKFFEWEKTQK